MSRNDEKAGNTIDMDFSALDLELAEMARETPDIPEGFHDKWMQAVREDAKNNPREDASAGADKNEHRQADIRRQRRHILSAAAAFVLVIGGVWLLKDRTDLLNQPRTTSVPAAQEETVPAPGPEENGEVLSADSDETAIMAAGMSDSGAEEAPEAEMNYAAVGSAGEAASQASAITDEDAESAFYEADAESPDMVEEAAGYAEAEEYAPSAAAVPLYAAMQAENTAAEKIGRKTAGEAAENETLDEAAEEEPAYKAAEPEMTPAPTATPEMTPLPTATPEIPEAKEQPEPRPEPPAAAAATAAENQDEEENVSFLQRLWDFLLRITPWALGVVVIALFLVTYVIRAKQRKGK